MSDLVAQDLSGDALLQGAPLMQTTGGRAQPVLGGYVLMSKIGESDGGGCYRAIHPQNSGSFAVKVTACSGSPDSERRKRFLMEAQAAMLVASPHLVAAIDMGVEGHLFYHVREFVSGVSAQEHLAQLKLKLAPGMKEAAMLDVCIAACKGLSAAHQADVPHLDVQPGAILIPELETGEGLDFAAAKLADLGLAHNDDAARLLNDSLARTGTPGYMSPEQVQGLSVPGKASDVFSLGATIYALMAGQPPFGGITLPVVLQATILQEPNNLRMWRPDASRATARLVGICLSKNPQHRFPDADTLLKALQICREALSLPPDAQLTALQQIEALAPKISDPFEQALIEVSANSSALLTAVPVEPANQKTRDTSQQWDMRAGASVMVPGLLDVTGLSRPSSTDLCNDLLLSKPGQPPAEDVDAAAPVAAPPPFPPAPPATPDTSILPETSDDLDEKNEMEAGIEKPLLPLELLKVPPPPPFKPQQKKWMGPALHNHEEDASAPKRLSSRALALAGIVLLAGAGAAWQLGYLPIGKPAKEITRVTPTSVEDPLANVPPTNMPPMEKTSDLTLPVADLPKPPPADPTSPPPPDPAADEAEKKLAFEKEQQRLAEEQARAEKAAQAKAAREAEAAEAAEKLRQAEVAAAAAKAAKDAKDVAEKIQAEARQAALAEEAIKAVREAELKSRVEPAVATRREGDPAVPAQVQEMEITVDLGDNVAMVFVLAPKGVFNMGTDRAEIERLSRAEGADPKDHLDEAPVREVKMDGFYIAKTPVTVAQFRRFVAATHYVTGAEHKGSVFTLQAREWMLTPGANWQKPGFDQGDDHPVVMLKYKDCLAFAEWAAKQTGRAMRLPTESEWEYAARGPKSLTYPWGNKWDGTLANHSDKRLQPFCLAKWTYSASDDGYAFTSPVGACRNQSWCGALDMAGNVFQWCAEVYEAYPQSPKAPRIVLEPAQMPANALCVLRGGSYLFRPIDCRGAARRALSPASISGELGMRLVFTPGK
jgi:sulfatase modifying factor 1